ncbi:MAG: hypothetical protein K5897_02140 [Eubacterium sp.]|nr:hypothetical protein [Eubacterium sp.]
MGDVWAELGTYLLKYGVFLILAILGFICGTKWRKAKNSKQEQITTQETMEESKQ